MRVDLSQRLPFPGKLALRGEVAVAEAEVASRDFESARLRLALMASRLFDEYQLAARSQVINAEHARLLGELQRVATARYETGEAAQSDPLQAEVERTTAPPRGGPSRHGRVAAEQIQTCCTAAGRRPAAARAAPAPAELPGADPKRSSRRRARVRCRWRTRLRAGESRVDLARHEFLPDSRCRRPTTRSGRRRTSSLVGLSSTCPCRRPPRGARTGAGGARRRAERARRAVDEARFGAQRLAARARGATCSI
jgi:outer membrane protein TolC